MSSPPAGHETSTRAHWSLYGLVIVLTLYVLARGAPKQIFDTNFYTLWEATDLLAGDHPYRDFYEWGVPLQAAMSAAVQVLTGHRLIGEFAIHWLCIVLSVVLSFHLALRLSRSVTASLIAVCIMVPILAPTPTFHYAKLIFYPFAVWLAWRYMSRPTAWMSAVLGATTAAAFLYRHDHGLYIGFASVIAFALGRLAGPASGQWRSFVRDVLVYGAVAAVILVPWAAVVQMNEGLPDYVRTRGELGEMWAPNQWPFLILRDFDPRAVFAGSMTEDGRSWLPNQDAARHWLVHVTLLLPALVLVTSGIRAIERAGRRVALSADTCRALLTSAVAVIVITRLLREEGYFVLLLPLTAALGARALASRAPAAEEGRVTSAGVAGRVKGWRIMRQGLAVAGAIVTVVAVLGFTREVPLFSLEPSDPPFPLGQLMSSPAIDAFAPADAARQVAPVEWAAIDRDIKQKIMMRYMHDCTREGDRVLVTGSTPYQVGYYVDRPIAGGQLFWHHRWRSDPAHEAQSLTLLTQQSVPFAFSTHDPILEDFAAYPAIRNYLSTYYTEIDGSGELLLVDSRRQPTGRFGALGFPCFR